MPTYVCTYGCKFVKCRIFTNAKYRGDYIVAPCVIGNIQSDKQIWYKKQQRKSKQNVTNR